MVDIPREFNSLEIVKFRVLDMYDVCSDIWLINYRQLCITVIVWEEDIIICQSLTGNPYCGNILLRSEE